jgi:hypothetical protein
MHRSVSTVTKTVTDGAIAIGCTSSAVDAATAEGLVECRVDTSKVVAVPEPIVAMSCSDDDGYFIGRSGKLYKQFEESFVPINGLPPVVKVSVGIQHCAAIAADGRVFVWGFNPSGQVGIGSDRAVQVPICVLEGAQQVACGVHNTWVLIAPGPPHAPAGIDDAVIKPRPPPSDLRKDLPFSERLCL